MCIGVFCLGCGACKIDTGGTTVPEPEEMPNPEPTVVMCSVFDPAVQEVKEWLCEPGQVCVMHVDGTMGSPSEIECFPSVCQGDNISCGCLLTAGQNPCDPLAQRCEGIIGLSIKCAPREN